jgi:gluconokinase
MTANDSPRTSESQLPLFIVGGPAGCGKSTTGKAIAEAFNFSFVEGDELHSPQNIAKMSSGQALGDEDRWDWLDKIISSCIDIEKSVSLKGIVVTCSSLKRSYRDRLRLRVEEARRRGSSLREYFVFCNLSEETSLNRVENRKGHYMKASMVASQFRDLEVPVPEMEKRVHVINAEKSRQDVYREAINYANSCITAAR